MTSKNDEQAIAEGCTFDADAATRAVTFIERYVIPTTVGKPIRLLPWQRRVVEQLNGWKRPDGRNRYRRATISTAKKNGKTILVSALLLYGLLGGCHSAPFVASASTSRENASQVYREIAHSIRANDKLLKVCKCLDSTKEIRCKSKSSRYRAFSADAGASEGENLAVCVVDEAHAHVSDRLYRSLEYSSISRPDGLFVNVSTSGADMGHFWYDVFKYAQDVQADNIIDTSVFAFICTSPEGSDIDDQATWAMSNPSMGLSFTEDDFRRDLDRAKRAGTADLLSFKRYRLNQWCAADDSYIDPVKWDRCLSPMSDDQLRPFPCWIGADLASTTDTCSVSLTWALPDRKFYVRCHSWVCQDGVRRREQSNLPQYRAFAADKVMTITPGDANDYRKIKAYILDQASRYDVREIIFDQYNALEMAADLMAEGLTVYRQPQNHKHFTGPIKDFSVAIDEQRIAHDGNRYLRWALANTILDVDSYGNAKPARDKSTDKIDGTISTLMAFARALEQGPVRKTPSVYNERGVIVI